MDIVDFVPNTMSFNDGMAGFNEITNKGSTKEEMHKMKGIFSLLKFPTFIFMANLLTCCILLKYTIFLLAQASCVKG